MQTLKWNSYERWDWLAAGDPDVAPDVLPSESDQNSPRRLLFETALALLIPLVLAALIEIIL